MSSEPTYLVQTQDGVLHAYWSKDILLWDIGFNRPQKVKLFKKQYGFKLSYRPVTEVEIRDQALREACKCGNNGGEDCLYCVARRELHDEPVGAT